MKTFLQIGNKVINVHQIVEVWFAPDAIHIELAILDGDSAAHVVLRGDEAVAFREWWEKEADVYCAG